eukprot:COSAG03_NODE_4097_length_1687_cov_14.225441_5_plen_70_part_01
MFRCHSFGHTHLIGPLGTGGTVGWPGSSRQMEALYMSDKRDEHQENCKLQQRNEVGPTLAKEVRIRNVNQ